MREKGRTAEDLPLPLHTTLCFIMALLSTCSPFHEPPPPPKKNDKLFLFLFCVCVCVVSTVMNVLCFVTFKGFI